MDPTNKKKGLLVSTYLGKINLAKHKFHWQTEHFRSEIPRLYIKYEASLCWMKITFPECGVNLHSLSYKGFQTALSFGK